MRDVGGTLIVIGFVVVVLGLLARAGLLGWVGRLPGDIRFQSGNGQVFIPITTSIVASILISVVISLLRR